MWWKTQQWQQESRVPGCSKWGDARVQQPWMQKQKKKAAYLWNASGRQEPHARYPCLHYQPLHEFWEGWVLAPPVLVTQVHAVHLWSKGAPLGWLYLLPGAQPTAVSGCGLAFSLHTFLRLQHSSKSFQFKDLSPFEDKALWKQMKKKNKPKFHEIWKKFCSYLILNIQRTLILIQKFQCFYMTMSRSPVDCIRSGLPKMFDYRCQQGLLNPDFRHLLR